jgi:AraC-like DNA-binding protein
MTAYTFHENNYSRILGNFAMQTGVPEKGQVIEMPASIATGYTKVVELPGNISALVSECTYTSDFIFQRQKDERDFYVLQFDELVFPRYEKPPGAAIQYSEQKQAELFFFTPGMDRQLIRRKGMIIKSVKVILTPEWLQKYMGPDADERIKEAFLNRLPGRVFSMPMPKEMQVTLKNVLAGDSKSGTDCFYLQNRILLLIEQFLYQISQSLNNNTVQVSDYTMRIIKAEQELTKRVGGPAPTVAELAREAAMSITSFKKYFKKVYGIPVYRYYIKLRLLYARSLLQKKMSPAETAQQAGYANTYHFVLAYKKEFGEIPVA